MRGLTAMKRHRHTLETLEQVVRKLREGEHLLNEGSELTKVLRHLEISEATWNRWGNSRGASRPTRCAASKTSSARMAGSGESIQRKERLCLSNRCWQRSGPTPRP